jgi:hypothetical protein
LPAAHTAGHPITELLTQPQALNKGSFLEALTSDWNPLKKVQPAQLTGLDLAVVRLKQSSLSFCVCILLLHQMHFYLGSLHKKNM